MAETPYISSLTGQQMDAALEDMGNHTSEAWAVGKRDGVDVNSNDETYENNSKYYAEYAARVVQGTVTEAVRYDVSQSLSAAEKSQARANIGAISGDSPSLTTPSMSSPSMSGEPTAPTASTDTNTTQVATTAFVIAEIKTYLGRTNKVTAANTSYTSYMARGEALVSTETTPSYNGQIAWLYE